MFSDYVIEKFRTQVVYEPLTGCLLWTGNKFSNGYGFVYVTPRPNRRAAGAHRVAYEMVKGIIPAGLTIDHLCRNKGCVNPDHLEAVTQAENNRRANTKTHCKYGHALVEGNLYFNRKGQRGCRACSIRNALASTKRKRAALKCS